MNRRYSYTSNPRTTQDLDDLDSVTKGTNASRTLASVWPILASCRAQRWQRYRDTEHARHEARVRRQLAEWTAAYQNKQRTTTTAAQVAVRDDLLAQLQVLQDHLEHWDETDVGPLYDCVVCFDGTTCRAAIDVHETGDFSSITPLAAFGLERQYGTFFWPRLVSHQFEFCRACLWLGKAQWGIRCFNGFYVLYSTEL
jgi:hypothetical protein